MYYLKLFYTALFLGFNLNADSILLKWNLNDVSENVEYYSVLQSKDGNPYRLLTFINSSTSFLRIKNVKNGVYKYVVYAYNGGGATPSRVITVIVKNKIKTSNE